MTQTNPTTPFGRRSLTLAHVANRMVAKSRPPGAKAHKWTVFQAICAAKAKLGLTERALAVLDALLSFHPETVLTGDDLIVFPSNARLALRAHGMAPSTLRRQLAILVDAGIVLRKDSPNGKRYARRAREGRDAEAFGFDLSPLVARAAEFERLAEEVRFDERRLRLLRERVTLARRDIAKMIETAVAEGAAPPALDGTHAVRETSWAAVRARYRDIVDCLPRRASIDELTPLAEALGTLVETILTTLENHVNFKNPSANESNNGRHEQNSNPNRSPDFEPSFQKSPGATVEPLDTKATAPIDVVASEEIRAASASVPAAVVLDLENWTPPLGLVLEACPDIADYAPGGVAHWRDLVAAAEVVRPALGISPSAWNEALEALGDRRAATLLAAILQRGALVSSPGGYLRELTRKAQAGAFSLGPMIMAALAARRRDRKSA
ncbi:MAG: replication initiation protein RepC [Hyphomicrobiales bacterium]|nr:replication initiation protein RepC [Hyphomicrobiales bacterium]MDE2017859.1 replication initiation protein RepC [Hyphomicrobiales bacterium]